MKILALEFSAMVRSVAVVVDGRRGPAIVRNEPRSTCTSTMVEEALQGARMEQEDVECIAIGLGPGSYNGIRAAIAFAQGWQIGIPVELRGVATTECLAAQAQAEGWNGRVHVVIDAQRRELHLVSYDITAESIGVAKELRIVTLDEARRQTSDGGRVIGPEATRWFAEGQNLSPDAVQLAVLAGQQPGPSSLNPLYLRETTFVKAPPLRTIPAR